MVGMIYEAEILEEGRLPTLTSLQNRPLFVAEQVQSTYSSNILPTFTFIYFATFQVIF